MEEKEQITTDNSSNKVEQLDRFTLEYLLNSSLYNKIKQSNAYLQISHNERRQYKKELKFYRHRILDLTKKFIKNKGRIDEFEDDSMNEAFKVYSSILISYFKKTDTIDTFQDNYIGLDTLEKALTNSEEDNNNYTTNNDNNNITNNKENNIDEADKLMANIKKVPVNLDSFVIKKKNKHNNNQEVIPIKKEVDLTDPKFKKKGVQKKNKESEEQK